MDRISELPRVLELQLDDEYEGGLIRFPSVFCSCNNTLGILELSGMLLLDFPSRVGLKSLKKLRLIYVKFKDEESVCNLLCGCPILEELVVHRRGICDAETFTIAVPSLQRLTIVDTFLGKVREGYVINAPSLKCLNITAGEIKCPTGINFYHLVSLELNTSKRGWSNLLAYMLDSSPKLQILKLIIDAYCYDIKVSGSSWGEWEQRPKCVPECLLFHLETLVWKRYIWDRKDDKDVATYILKNARRLKKATFYTEPIQLQNLQTLEEKHEMLNELASVVRASNSCNLVFESSN
ncbi:FBD-associated F-box protein [Raphanus sativus]|nr:FBD-associated F-box protein [Raphanus sativus]